VTAAGSYGFPCRPPPFDTPYGSTHFGLSLRAFLLITVPVALDSTLDTGSSEDPRNCLSPPPPPGTAQGSLESLGGQYLKTHNLKTRNGAPQAREEGRKDYEPLFSAVNLDHKKRLSHIAARPTDQRGSEALIFVRIYRYPVPGGGGAVPAFLRIPWN